MKFDYETGIVVNPQAPADSLEAKQPYIDNGTGTRGKDCYFSREAMQQEWERLWPRAWLIAGVSSDAPAVGDYFLFDIGSEAIIVARTEAGLKAHYNVCPHRGSRLVRAERGSRARFICPFHSWKFDLEGKLLAVTDRETFREEVICHEPGLTSLACEEHAGIVFVSMRDDPPPLVAWLGLPEGYLEAYRIDQMKVVRHVRTEWAANWKVGVEAFYETYHLHAVHPETRGVMADLRVQCDLYANGASRMIVPIGQMTPRIADQDSLNDGLRMMLASVGLDPAAFEGRAGDVRPAIQQAKRARAAERGVDYSDFVDGQLTDSWATGIFPNVQIGCHPEGVFLMRFLPHETDPERFWYDTMTLIAPCDHPDYKVPDWMGLPEGTDTSGRVRPLCEVYTAGQDGNLGMVLDQDAGLLPVVQRGMRSRGFKHQLWSEQEQRLRHFHAELARYLDGAK
jgi:phenylpropionate dioxygenase-like ring-hydroxylating dioxygenase large terminal subunit